MQSVGVRFDGHPPVLEAVDFSVREGEFVSIVGPSGCGKTTILRLIAHLVEPTTGRVEVRGCAAHRLCVPGTESAAVAQRHRQYPTALELLGVPRPAQQPSIEDSLRLIGLQAADYRKYPRMLSGGMKMRVSLARAMVTKPGILLLDEPFAALDDMLRQQLNEDLLAIWQDQQWTAVFVTHNVAEAVFLSQRVLIMSAHPGQIIESVKVPFAYPRQPALRGTGGVCTADR